MNHKSIVIFVLGMLSLFQSKAQLQFFQTSYDFGVLSNWSESPAIFAFKNNYSEPIAILNFKNSESVKIKFPSSYIQPGQTDTLLVYYEPLDLGKFNEKIEIYTSADDKPALIQISGRVNSYLECPSAYQANDPSQLIYIHQGVVIDKTTQEAMPGVEVYFFNPRGQKIKLKTDKKGRFKKKFEIGQYLIQIEQSGYRFFEKELYLNRNTPFIVLELESGSGKIAVVEDEEIEEEWDEESKVEEKPVTIVENKEESGEPEKPVANNNETNHVKINTHTSTSANKVLYPNAYFTLKGKIIDQYTGEALPKILIRFTNTKTNRAYLYKTMKNGAFSQNLKAGEYQITISAKGYELFGEKIMLNSDMNKQIVLNPLPDGEVAPTNGKKFIVQSGIINDAASNLPVKGASVSLKNMETGKKYLYRTMADGKFSKRVPVGTYQLIVEANNYKTKGKLVKINADTGPLNIALDKSGIEVIPKTEQVFLQKAIAIDTFIKLPVKDVLFSFYNKDIKRTYNYRALEDGVFSKEIRGGNYIVRVSADGYRPIEKEIELPLKKEELSFEMYPTRQPSDLVIGEKKEQNIKTDNKILLENKFDEIRDKYKNASNSSRIDSVDKKVVDKIAIKTESKGSPDLPDELLPRDIYAANNIVFLVDVSSSMSKSHKIEYLKYAMNHLTGILRDIDNISIITYSTQPTLVLSAVAADRKDTIFKSIDSMQAKGFTYGLRGLQEAYHLAEANFIDNGNNEVIIATDGEFNSPDYSELQLIKMITSYARKDIILSVIGFGQNDKALRTMRRMAVFGKGNFLHITGKDKAQSILIEEIKLNSLIVEYPEDE